jgi:CRP-like cAMP-binding protein
VRDALRRAVAEVPRILGTPAPIFRLKQFADSGVEYQVKVWVEDIANMPDILSDLRVQIWYHFRRAGIEIPYPIRDVRERPPAVEDPESKPRAILERLRSVPFFDALPAELLTILSRDAGLSEYGAGERVVQAGESGDTAYVVDSGRLAVLISDGKAERQVATFSPGDFFGEMSLLTGEPRSATVRAIDDARLVTIGSTSLRAALERAPDLAQRLAEVAALRKEGLLEARAALDATSKARVADQAYRLRELITRFFRLPDSAGATGSQRPPPPPSAPPAPSGGARVAGGPPAP